MTAEGQQTAVKIIFIVLFWINLETAPEPPIAKEPPFSIFHENIGRVGTFVCVLGNRRPLQRKFHSVFILKTPP